MNGHSLHPFGNCLVLMLNFRRGASGDDLDPTPDVVVGYGLIELGVVGAEVVPDLSQDRIIVVGLGDVAALAGHLPGHDFLLARRTSADIRSEHTAGHGWRQRRPG